MCLKQKVIHLFFFERILDSTYKSYLSDLNISDSSSLNHTCKNTLVMLRKMCQIDYRQRFSFKMLKYPPFIRDPCNLPVFSSTIFFNVSIDTPFESFRFRARIIPKWTLNVHQRHDKRTLISRVQSNAPIVRLNVR